MITSIDDWKDRFATACNRGSSINSGVISFHNVWFEKVKDKLSSNLESISDLLEYSSILGTLSTVSRIVYLSKGKEILICEDGLVYIDISQMANPPKSYNGLASVINSVYSILFFANQFLNPTNNKDIQKCGEIACNNLLDIWYTSYPSTKRSFILSKDEEYLRTLMIPMLTETNLVH